MNRLDPKRTSSAVILFFTAWVLVCVGLYLWKIPPHPLQSLNILSISLQNSPWTWNQMAWVWLEHALWLFTFAGSLAVFLGTGNYFLKLLGPGNFSTVEKWIWSLALGWIFWSLLAEGLAFEKLLFVALLRGLFISACILWLLMDRGEALARCWPFRDKVELPRLWIGPVAAVALLSLANILAPEMSWDALTYQLILPKFYFLNHGFYTAVGMVPAHYPSWGQMLFVWGLLWGDDSLARSFCFLAHLGSALVLVVLGTRLLNSKVGWMAGVIYWVFPYLNILSTRGYVDLFTGFYGLLGLGGILLFLSNQEDGSEKVGFNQKLIFGFLGTLALSAVWGVKYNAVSFWLPGILVLAVTSFKRSIPLSLWMGLIGFPMFFWGPWALKSWVFTHNPIYPYFANHIESFNWTDFDQKASTLKFTTEGWRGMLKLPQVLWGIFFNNYGGAPHEEVSLIPLVFFPLALSGWRFGTWRIPLVVFCVFPFLFWMVTSHQLRLVSTVIALASLGLAAGVQQSMVSWKGLEKYFNLTLCFLLWMTAYYLFQGLIQQPNPFACSLGIQSRSEFLKGILLPKGVVRVSDYLNSNLPQNAKILILGQQNGYYLDRVSIYDFDYNHSVLKKWVESSDSPAGIYARFKESGFTHILYNSGGMMGTVVRVEALGVDRYPWKPMELKNYEQFFLKFTRKIPLPVGEGYSLYEVLPRTGFSTMPEFLPGTEYYYLANMKEILGLARLSQMVGKSISSDVYLRSYEKVCEQQPELGYPCFQLAFAELTAHAEAAGKALAIGRKGYERNGDKSSWLTLQADALLAHGKTQHAIKLLEAAQGLSPEREDVARNLASAYYNVRNFKKASEQADRAEALAPYSEEYHQLAKQLRTLLSTRSR